MTNWSVHSASARDTGQRPVPPPGRRPDAQPRAEALRQAMMALLDGKGVHRRQRQDAVLLRPPVVLGALHNHRRRRLTRRDIFVARNCGDATDGQTSDQGRPYTFDAHFETAAAPKTCVVFKKLLPYDNKIIHVRWSGEGVWIPRRPRLGATYENHTSYPAPAAVRRLSWRRQRNGNPARLWRRASRQQGRPARRQPFHHHHVRSRSNSTNSAARCFTKAPAIRIEAV